MRNDGCCSSHCPSPQWLEELAVHINEFVIWESLVLLYFTHAYCAAGFVTLMNLILEMNYPRFTIHLFIFRYTWDLNCNWRWTVGGYIFLPFHGFPIIKLGYRVSKSIYIVNFRFRIKICIITRIITNYKELYIRI